MITWGIHRINMALFCHFRMELSFLLKANNQKGMVIWLIFLLLVGLTFLRSFVSRSTQKWSFDFFLCLYKYWYTIEHDKLKNQNHQALKLEVAWDYKLNEKTGKCNKPREILKGLKNCIWKTRFFLKKEVLRIFQFRLKVRWFSVWPRSLWWVWVLNPVETPSVVRSGNL